MLKDFKEFLFKQNAVALAIGVIIGVATSKVVSAIADDVINPILGLMLPGGAWREAKILLTRNPEGPAILYGHLLGTLVDFAIIALVVFLIAKQLLPKKEAPPTKECPQCKEIIPAAATRCRACTQPVV